MYKDKKDTKGNHISQTQDKTKEDIPGQAQTEPKDKMQEHGASKTDYKETHIFEKPKAKKKHILVTEEEYEALKKDAKSKEELQDKLLRLQAEFENVRKRLEKERQEFIRYASEDTIKGLIGIIDDFERALSASKNTQDFNILYKGIEMILRQLEEFLSKKGLTRIKTVGEAFDPSRHEALEVVSDDTKPENTVVEEILKGYSLNEKILRAAVVKISKKSNETNQSQNVGG